MIIKCTNRTQIKNIGQYIKRAKRKWENKNREEWKTSHRSIKVKRRSKLGHERKCTPQQPGVKWGTVPHKCVE
jgi:hypothetical protein